MFTEPLRGFRTVSVREHKTAIDWATEVRQLLDLQYPEAERIRLVCDNLNTQEIGSLYEAFPPEQARRLASRLEIHHTPQARQLAQYRRDRAQCPDETMPGSAAPRS
jgi:transcriptional regulator of aromatic amino acid metabolism